MKPSFALDFRDGTIALLHRTSRGWQQVGATAFDAADLGEALGYLRSTALGLSPRGMATKLVIPNEQVLYTTVHAPGPEAAKRRKQIKAALEGLTPYKVDELVFDWFGSGPEVQVAVVARETLAEAEAFAAEHRLNPVSFVAVPDNGAYLGEPFFGPSALSATLLAEGEKVERDQDPISVVARDYPRAEAPVATPPAAEPAPEPEPAPPAPTAVAAAEPEPAAPPVAEPEPAPSIAAAAEPAPVPDPEPVANAEANPLPDFTEARLPPEGAPAFDPKAMAVDLVDEAPMALDVAVDPPEVRDSTPAEPPATAKVEEDLPPAPAPSILAAFASRRTGDAAEKPAPEVPPADFAKAAAEARARKAPAVGPAPSQRPSVPRPTLARPAASQPAAQRDTLPFPGRTPQGKALPLKGKTAVAAPPAAASAAKRNVVPLAKPASDAAAEAAKSAPRKATGLDGKPLPVRGKPRYLGLILTGLLLLALAVVAAWSSFSLSTGTSDTGAQPTDAAVAEATTPTDPNLPSAQDEALADGQDPSLAAEDLTAADTAEPAPVTETAVAAADPSPPDPAAAEPAPQTGVVTDAAVAAQPGNDPQDEIFLAAADVAPGTSDAVLLPQPTAGSDPPPQLGAPPPPFGTVYAFDADGRIRPTPEGIITPEGVLLVEGAPKRVPPSRPAALTATTPTDAAAAQPEAAPAAQPDPALAGKKPRPRPAGLEPPIPTTDQQGEAASPAPGSRFAEIRPLQRPAALTAAAEPPLPGADEAAAAASLAAAGLQNGTGLALAVSRKPMARPSGMDQAVNAAVAAALETAQPQAEEPQPQTASLAPEDQAEPEVEAAAPSIPSNASVAKQATTKDALNLNKVALIGIFGNSAGRYAMIRQAGGGIKKVKVGDTIDGGRVAAITATELQYQKGGRMLTLTLPKG